MAPSAGPRRPKADASGNVLRERNASAPHGGIRALLCKAMWKCAAKHSEYSDLFAASLQLGRPGNNHVGRRVASSNLTKCASATNDHPVFQLMTTLFFRPHEPINSSTGKTTAVPPLPLLNGDEEPLLGSSRASPPPPNGRSSNGTQRPIHFRRRGKR